MEIYYQITSLYFFKKLKTLSTLIVTWLFATSIAYVAQAEDKVSETFSLKEIQHGIFLPVTINDLSYTFLFDTGATFSIMDSSFKPLLGKAIKKEKVEASVGKAEVEFYKPVDIYFRNINMSTKHNLLASDLSFLTKVSGKTFHGILGMANLYKHVWDIDFDDLLIVARSSSTQNQAADGFKSLDIIPTKQGIPSISVNITDQNILFILDTGDNGFGRLQPQIIDSLIEKNLIQSVARDTTVSMSGVHDVRRVRVREISIGESSYKNVVMTESQQNALGLGFLKRHHVILDFPAKKFHYKVGLHSMIVDREDKSGLKLVSHDDKIYVANIDEMGPAAKAGIKTGDFLIEMNGERIVGGALVNVREAFKDIDGKNISLVLSRNNERIDIKFKLQEGFDFVSF